MPGPPQKEAFSPHATHLKLIHLSRTLSPSTRLISPNSGENPGAGIALNTR